MRFETIVVHSGLHIDEETGAVATPIHLSTTFQRDLDGGTSRGYSYLREGNPNQTRLEEALAGIEGGAAALAFASGMSAISCLLQALPAGSHVVLPDDSYYAVRIIAADYLARWGITSDLVPMEDLDAVRAAMRESTSAIWAESPSNPLMKICDLRALAELAHSRGAMLLVDGTFATPALQRPLELGADAVAHSTTKYLGGHTDVMGGSAAFARREEYFERVRHARYILGGVPSPFNSWLVLRGIRTLAARMRVHCENARAVAQFLASHPRVEAVHYPGLASHPGHDVAKRQMSDFGGMLSFRVRGGAKEALDLVAKTMVFTRATSLGGVESLVEHRASSEGHGSTTPPNLLRLSVGLEHPADLVEDLRQALE